MTATALEARLAPALLALRLGVGLVFFMWTLDKFVNPDHAIRVFQHFYMIPFLTENGSYVVGTVQALLVGSFIAGFMRTWTYGAIFLLHAVSTLTPMANYFNPWEGVNLLFFAAWPMLAAAGTLWWLRDYDTLFNVDAARGA